MSDLGMRQEMYVMPSGREDGAQDNSQLRQVGGKLRQVCGRRVIARDRE